MAWGDEIGLVRGDDLGLLDGVGRALGLTDGLTLGLAVGDGDGDGEGEGMGTSSIPKSRILVFSSVIGLKYVSDE